MENKYDKIYEIYNQQVTINEKLHAQMEILHGQLGKVQSEPNNQKMNYKNTIQ